MLKLCNLLWNYSTQKIWKCLDSFLETPQTNYWDRYPTQSYGQPYRNLNTDYQKTSLIEWNQKKQKEEEERKKIRSLYIERQKILIKQIFNYKFKESNKYLCYNGVYSPFGIACLVYQKDKGDMIIDIEEDIIKFDKSLMLLPIRVREYFDIPYYLEKELYNFCSNNNDADKIALEFIHKLRIFPSTCKYSYLGSL